MLLTIMPIKAPPGIDFEIKSRLLTKEGEEEIALSESIRAYNAIRSQK